MSRAKLGQVFLQDSSIVAEIVNSLDIHQRDTIIEIGPGKGVLTGIMAKSNCKLIAIELDNILHKRLIKKFENNSNVTIIHADILKTSLADILGHTPHDKVKIVGNIPYYITSPILNYLVLNKIFFKTSIIMMQQEVGERILASPHSRTYGALTLFIQYHMLAEKIIKVPKECFSPQPEVNSIVLRLSPRTKPIVKVDDEELFSRIIQISFQKRRKMLHNSLSILKSWGKDIDINKLLNSADIKSSVRAEDLSIYDYARLCAVIHERIIKKKTS